MLRINAVSMRKKCVYSRAAFHNIFACPAAFIQVITLVNYQEDGAIHSKFEFGLHSGRNVII